MNDEAREIYESEYLRRSRGLSTRSNSVPDSGYSRSTPLYNMARRRAISWLQQLVSVHFGRAFSGR